MAKISPRNGDIADVDLADQFRAIIRFIDNKITKIENISTENQGLVDLGFDASRLRSFRKRKTDFEAQFKEKEKAPGEGQLFSLRLILEATQNLDDELQAETDRMASW